MHRLQYLKRTRAEFTWVLGVWFGSGRRKPDSVSPACMFPAFLHAYRTSERVTSKVCWAGGALQGQESGVAPRRAGDQYSKDMPSRTHASEPEPVPVRRLSKCCQRGANTMCGLRWDAFQLQANPSRLHVRLTRLVC